MKELVEKYLIDNNIPLYTQKERKSYIDAIIYGVNEAGISQDTLTRFAKKYFPDKPKHVRIKNWILKLHGLKSCFNCEKVLSIENFSVSSYNTNGLRYICKECDYRDYVKPTKNAVEARRRAAKLQRTTAWSELESIKEFYKNCPSGYHVDHIIPLQGKNVSGLHVLSNLQYLLASENFKKSNNFNV